MIFCVVAPCDVVRTMQKPVAGSVIGSLPLLVRHCEERSDEAIHLTAGMDSFASLAMTRLALHPAHQLAFHHGFDHPHAAGGIVQAIDAREFLAAVLHE